MEIITRLKGLKEETIKFYDIKDNTILSQTYGPGKWTIKQILHHLSDAETVLYERIRRIISESKSVLWAFDPDLWADNLGYEGMDLSISKAIYVTVRDGIIELTERHYESKGYFEFIHSETGLRTLKDEIDKVLTHNESHLDQMRKAL